MFLKIFFYVDKAQKTEMEKREKERKDRTKVNKNSNYCTHTLPSSFKMFTGFQNNHDVQSLETLMTDSVQIKKIREIVSDKFTLTNALKNV